MNELVIQHLTKEERTSEIRLAAVKSNGHAVRFLTKDERTLEVCLEAVSEY
jgi:hypothetical protein